ncbi:MAG: PAS domain-containing sensor histidine kinase [Gammaproteobacteria bacterium]|nr:PAS domain-containing sensor histidine kinase [Gammaproteobacteria bacterium]
MNAANELKFLRRVVANLPEHVYWVDKNSVILGCNNAQAELFNSTPEEMIGISLSDILPEEYAKSILANNEIVISSGQDGIYEETYVAANGREITFLSHKTPLFGEDGGIIGVSGISIDITQYKDLEEIQIKLFSQIAKKGDVIVDFSKLEHLNDYIDNVSHYLESIISLMPGHVYWKNRDGVILGCNDNMAKYFGFKSRMGIAGLTDYDILDAAQADYVRKHDLEVMNSKQPRTIEEAEDSVVFLSRKEPILNDSDEVIGLLGVSLDVTEQKRLERALKKANERETRLIEEQHSAKIRALQAMSASIAHELHTPLMTINNQANIKRYLEDLVQGYEAAQKAGLEVPFIRPSHISAIQKGLDSIGREADNARNIINELLANLKELNVSPEDLSRCSIVDCIVSVLSRYTFASSDERKLLHVDEANDFDFLGKELLCSHILFNLLRNAFYYIAKAKKGEVRLWLKHGTKYNEMHFRDTGAGIAACDLPHIFDHFFSQTEGGTGVGLSFCEMAMQNMGGDMTCDSREGEYTEFVLLFPKLLQAADF